MIPSGSRYEQAEHHFTLSHLYSDRGYPLLEGEVGLVTLRIRTALRDTLFLLTTEPEPIGDVTDYYAKELESFPFLGFKILDDSTRWWELAELNPQVWYPLDIQPGTRLKVPL
jgi:hypothetical protein